jgi:hypothetical protein
MPTSDSELQTQARRILDAIFQQRCKVMQTQLHEQLSLSDAEVILLRLPERIRAALIDRAAEIEYPIEAVVEMAIASFLDTEALGFVDCKPGRGQ